MNVLYLFYYIIKTDYTFIRKELNKKIKPNKLRIYSDIVYSTLRYGSSFEDFFIYDFLTKSHKERNSYVVTGLAHEFFKAMNDRKDIEIFRNKATFEKEFKDIIKRDFVVIDNVSKNEFIIWCDNKTRLIAKPLEGVEGKGISIHSVETTTEKESLYNKFKNKAYLIEEVIIQHTKLQELNPSSVNSIRAITVNINGEPQLIAAILRIGRGALVDNFTEGGIAAPIDLENGRIFRSAITRDNDKFFKVHPETHVKIVGFEIPNWDLLKETVLSAAKVVPSVRTVGWDIAVTEESVEIIEGNDNWNKNIYQITYGYGKKTELKNILKELK